MIHTFNNSTDKEPGTPTAQGPKARSIPAWGEARGVSEPKAQELKARPISFCATTLLLLLALAPAFAKMQHIVTIRIINAKTNHPITDERLNVALRADQIGSVAMPTDKHGIILVDTGQATFIRILSNMYADCRPRGELYTNYPIVQIHSNGITTGNLCSDARPRAKPGELILFEIPKTYIPEYPKPPASSLPHSDQNPH